MEPKGIVIFDLDDLLIMNVHWYWAGWQMFKDVMTRAGFRKYEDELVDTLNHYDAEGVKLHGFKKERFGEAMGEAYDHYCQLENMEPDREIREGLVDIGLSVYRHRPIPYPRMKEVLAYLKGRGYELYCVTKGDHDVQEDKIQTAGLTEFFNEIYYVQREKRQAIEKVLASHPGFPKSNIYFVGNSPRDDMKPAVDLRINAVLVYEYTWHVDELDFGGREKVRELDSLADLMDIL